MGNVDYVTWAVRWVHISTAIVAIGGVFFAHMAMMPAVRKMLDEPTRKALHDGVVQRWRRILHFCIGILVVTGGYNFYILGMKSGVKPMPYHAIFLVKFLLAMFVFFLWIALTSDSPGFAALRAKGGKLAMVLLPIGFLIVLLSGLLNQIRTAVTG